ncbi:MAG: NAD-dependent epimerase/dehydratase family protein, partial [Thermoanaerobaculia bacterium]|nr:NAD-dependent epimerase/dehydratase family protein [Thermoanaerobaculia bacterium]
MRVLVTGANGFLGRHLVEALRASGATPVALALDCSGLPAGVEFVGADVRDRAALADHVRRIAPEVVVHLAALSHVGGSWTDIPSYYAVNVEGSENLFAAAAGRRVLFASSAEVYGAVPEREQPIGEEQPLAPRSPYALTKAAGERLAVAAGATVVRLFNLLGPGQAKSFALPSFADQLAAVAAGEREEVLRVGNLEARRDFVHVQDAVDALLLLLERGAPATSYNLASGKARSIAEMLDRLRALSGVAVRLELDPERLRPTDIPKLAGRAERLAALGWTPSRGVDAALAGLWAEA